MATRITKPSVLITASSVKRAEDILKLIRSRQNTKYIGPNGKPCVPSRPWWIFQKHLTEPRPASPSADDWQKFKRDFVEEYAGEKVQATGMTHSDFFDYFKNGVRECDPPHESPLKKLLKEIGDKKCSTST
jgi:hypothetical protein